MTERTRDRIEDLPFDFAHLGRSDVTRLILKHPLLGRRACIPFRDEIFPEFEWSVQIVYVSVTLRRKQSDKGRVEGPLILETIEIAFYEISQHVVVSIRCVPL
jgi:hypothetical protein